MTSVRFPQANARYQGVSQREPSEGVRRALNVTVAAFGVILTAPAMAAIALLIKLTSRGPVFYTQLRVGIDRRRPGEPPGNSRRHVDHGGKPFKIYKFRTMTARNDATANEVWAARVSTL